MARFCSQCDALLDEESAALCPRCGCALKAPSLAAAAAGQAASVPAASVPAEPERIGRYRIVGTLGVGGVGAVYRGHDDELDRDVAVKLMHPQFLSSPRTMALFLSEGRILAGLDHPGIVPVYDLGQLADGRGYFVIKLIAGGPLRARLEQGRLPRPAAVQIIAEAAEAVHHAHQHQLVHRDIKPDNILLDVTGRAMVADFGLALREEEYGTGPQFVGTVRYMSPEQARGEGHRVDARSDIYSLGVVLFELLTGQLTTPEGTQEEQLDAIASREAPSPRQLDDSIPRELERICLKALAHRVSDRYGTAAELAADLRCWLADGSARQAEAGPVAIVPHGLRSFGERDADFFLELLPGPRDRDGLPESLAFWKARLECRAADQTFSVGVLYGPSGCGKSSLVKAGLLPRLGGHVAALYLEATPDQTEAQLAKLLEARFPNLPKDQGLTAALEQLRRGRAAGRKVVLVLDQFEQWLHAHAADESAELAQALRQCDGGQVQCLLLVRDDFWLGVSRFARLLEVPLREGVNCGLVDLFDREHARKVLAAFGRAFGKLPAGAVAAEQERFLDQAVDGLAQEGKVVAVRLSLFAEMVKDKAWAAATLRQLGGMQGIGAAFLEDTFGTAARRPHDQAARAVLKALLPEGGTQLKGQRRPLEELRQASGYADRPQDFADLMHLLDRELRLVTPVEDAAPSGERPTASGQLAQWTGAYQLTHDYLVPALREWLTRKQRETRRGRAELRLAERSAWWNSQPERRQLPGWWEWASISLLTDRRRWSEPQRAMMRSATRTHLVGSGLVLAALLLLALGWQQVRLWQAADLARQHVADQVAQLRSAPLRNVAGIIAALERDWPQAEPQLRAALAATDKNPRQRRNVRLALLKVDPGQVQPLSEELLSAGPAELLILRQFLLPYREKLIPRMWECVQAPEEDRRLLSAAGGLAAFDAGSPRWDGAGEAVAAALLRQNPLEMPAWLEAFRPVSRFLLRPLERIYAQSADPGQRRLAAVVLADYAADQPALLTQLLLIARPEQYRLLWPAFAKHGQAALTALGQELDRPRPAQGSDDEIGEAARRQAQAAVILLQLGHDQRVWPLLRRQPDPSVRSNLIHLLAALGTDPAVLARRLRQESDPGARNALILGLGESGPGSLDDGARKALAAEWLERYRTEGDAGLHTALDWTLRRWQQTAEVDRIDAALAGQPAGMRRWFINKAGQTLVVVPTGAELTEEDGKAGTRIPRAFAIGARNVTVGDFDRFQKAHPAYRYPDFPSQYIKGPESAMVWLTWYDAAAYCRWLSEQEGVAEEEMCYPPLDQIKPGLTMPANYLSRTGYRLPTAAEWRYATRAGAATPRFFGRGEPLVEQYGWYAGNSQARVQPVGLLKPNGFGLFDAYGNVWEWSQDRAWRPAAAEDREDPMPIDGQVARLVLGGSFADQAFALSSTSFVPRKPTECHVQYGMRLARTMR